jgi:hypothetical protein
VIDGKDLRVPQSVALGAYQALIVETVLEACRDGADAIIELGSGWSRNLFLTWLAGGPADARYVGAEFTESGRSAADRVAAIEPRVAFTGIPFDYHAPDLGAIGGYERAVVFTVHSIDMAPELDPKLFDEVRRVARSVTCLHFENFGWQKAGGAAPGYAHANDYNRNLYSLLENEQGAGRIELQTIRLDVVGLHPLYRTSVAVWRAGA